MKKIRVGIGVFLVGIVLLFAEGQFENATAKVFLVNIGVALITTAMVCFLEVWFATEEKDENSTHMKKIGVKVVCNSKSNEYFNRKEEIFDASDVEKKLLNEDAVPKKLWLLYSTGKDTIIDMPLLDLLEHGCDIKMLITAKEGLRNGTCPASNPAEVDDAVQRLRKIYGSLQSSSSGSKGSLKVRQSSVPPIASVEIRDNVCNVLPYYYSGKDGLNRIDNPYRFVCVKKDKEEGVYSQWKKHFDTLWDEASKIL